MTYAKHLADLLDLIGEPASNHLSDILTTMINDTDDIKRTLLLQLPHVITNLNKLSKGYNLIRDILIPILFSLIGNENIDIKENAGKILAQVGDMMNGKDRGEQILTKVLTMAHDDAVDDNKIVAIQLLTQMAHCFGQDLGDQFVGLEILSLGEDPQLRVRKESIINLPIIGNNVSNSFFQSRLLPFYYQKSQDSFWGIRKACVEILVEISKLCPQKIKEVELTELLLSFLKDTSKWVKVAAFKNLGPFIITLEDCKPSEKLFEHFIKMIDSSISSLSADNEILVSCAQYFPAVLKVFGEKKWPQLQKTFQFLFKSNIKKVKKSLACCLHEIAIIIGSDRAEKDLFNVLDSILNDTNEEVKYGAISNLAYFIEVFDNQKRENLLEVLLNVQKDQRKWRVRELIANQIGILAKMFTRETVSAYIVPISFKLCNDTVATVREEAAKNVHLILLELSKGNNYDGHVDRCVHLIQSFQIQNRFNLRQTFIQMCGQLLPNTELFTRYFLDSFVTLSVDKVTNVRIILARIVSEYLINNPNDNVLRSEPRFIKLVETLSIDKSRDVRIYFTEVQDFVQQKRNPNPIILKSPSILLKLVDHNHNDLQLEDKQVDDPQISNDSQRKESAVPQENESIPQEIKLNNEFSFNEIHIPDQSEETKNIKKTSIDNLSTQLPQIGHREQNDKSEEGNLTEFASSDNSELVEQNE